MKKIKMIILGSVVFMIAMSIFVWLTILSYARDLPSTSSIIQYRPNLVTKLFDKNGVLIDELFMERRNIVPLKEIPVDLQNAVLAIEDTNFFNHWGLDVSGVLRAFFKNFMAGHVVQGGSTISQQLAKVMFLTPEKKIKRKIKELILAMHIEKEFSKEEILQLYLNQIYFGEGAYGVETAAKIYFDKKSPELNLGECAMLAGLPRAPTSYSPENNIHLAYKRRAIVLKRMRELEFITPKEEINANCQPLPINTYEITKKVAPYFVEHIRKTLLPQFGQNMLYKGGLRIYTTLDLEMQKIAQKHVTSSLDMFDEIKQRELKEEIMKEQRITDMDKVVLSTAVYQEVQGALVSLDPRNGQIRAMVGGRDFENSEFNRATQAKRQPGSGFKPFIYTAAIDNGFTPATILRDEPRVYYNDGINWKLLENCTSFAQLHVDFKKLDELEEKLEELGEGKEETSEYKELEEKIEKMKKLKETIWSPQNYYIKFRGDLTLRNGIVKSVNCATVDLIDRVRPVIGLFYARKMGIKSKLPRTLSLALGSGDITPLELASSYCIFANQGIKTKPYLITKIEDYSGNIIRENFPEEKQVLSPQTNYIMVILCRTETSPEDIGGMDAANGILTARGGMTSHAAVVARGMGKCCVAGAGDIEIDYKKKLFKSGNVTVKEGDWISLNGSLGNVYLGKIKTVEPKLSGDFGKLMKLADEFRKLGVRTNADTPKDAEAAVKFGAEGIGLCRTEHMFFEGSRIISFRKLILVADTVKNLREQLEGVINEKERAQLKKDLEKPLKQYNQALKELLPLQRKDFEGIFKALKGMPCTIRLLDPPLHEFLPQDNKGQKEMAGIMGVSQSLIKSKVEQLHEFNPMLGHRGCRLGLTYPEVSAIQIQAIIEAAINVKKKGIKVNPEIMIPLVGNVKELEMARVQVKQVIKEVLKKKNLPANYIPYLIGTMIEVPRAAVTADQIAESAEFFSFGTNDLTQMGCGFSRDDAGKFLGDYVKMGIYDKDPFQCLDQQGIGKMMEIACKLGKQTRKNIKLGICGEHGGEPSSVEFCHKIGLNYVSCSPFRVPIARLSAAQAAIKK